MNDLDEPSDQMQAAIKSLQLRAWSAALTVRIARIAGDREATWQTASGVLIEFPRGPLIATAWHVLEQFKALRDAGELVALVCDNLPIPEPLLVYRDILADIAFIAVPRKHEGLNAVPYRPRGQWPPPKVTIDDTVLVCGFPKIFRDDDGPEIIHGDLNLLVSVTSVAERHFMMQVDWESLVQAGRVKLDAGRSDFGGASGGPAFLWDGGCNPLVGLVTEVGDNLPIWRIAALSSTPSDIETLDAEPL
jgi:hypothetical protein